VMDCYRRIYYLTIALTLSAIICTLGQITNDKSIAGLTIDPTIRIEVEKHISDSKFVEAADKFFICNNLLLAEMFDGGDLKLSTYNEKIERPFKSFYYWKGDTLIIDGAFGLFGGFGFNIKVVKGRATLYHMLASDEFPSYAYKKDSPLVFRLEVSCTETKIIVSELPDPSRNQFVYGFVEFQSGEYYTSNGSMDGKETFPRNKVKTNMKIYFKSGKSPF
jgi:hypothetical protein